MEKRYKMIFGNPPVNIGMGMMEGRPQQTMIITEDQKLLLDTICDVETNSELEKFYVCNRLKFKVIPEILTNNA